MSNTFQQPFNNRSQTFQQPFNNRRRPFNSFATNTFNNRPKTVQNPSKPCAPVRVHLLACGEH
eukprot:2714607-Heterocapsa_arctica.AAC.1